MEGSHLHQHHEGSRDDHGEKPWLCPVAEGAGSFLKLKLLDLRGHFGFRSFVAPALRDAVSRHPLALETHVPRARQPQGSRRAAGGRRPPPSRLGQTDTLGFCSHCFFTLQPLLHRQKDFIQSVTHSKPRASVWTGRIPARPRTRLPVTAADGGGGGGFQEARADSAACVADRHPGEAKQPPAGE